MPVCAALYDPCRRFHAIAFKLAPGIGRALIWINLFRTRVVPIPFSAEPMIISHSQSTKLVYIDSHRFLYFVLISEIVFSDFAPGPLFPASKKRQIPVYNLCRVVRLCGESRKTPLACVPVLDRLTGFRRTPHPKTRLSSPIQGTCSAKQASGADFHS